MVNADAYADAGAGGLPLLTLLLLLMLVVMPMSMREVLWGRLGCCPRMPKDAPGGFQSCQEASSYVFLRVGETHGAESYVFYRAGEAPGGPRRQLYT